MMYKIVIDDFEMELEYEEMVEILTAIRDTPERGHEFFDEAKEKAAILMRHVPRSNY